jgi:cation diffusion facilitator family transporter
MFTLMAQHLHDHRNHSHGDGHGYGKHGHTHGAIDPSITTSERGIWAIKWSFIGLAATALLQIVVVLLSHSVGLLADTIHNFGDAATAIPLWIAFMLSRWKPNEKFTYGYGRVEDLAGMAIVLTIFVSAVVAGYETVQRFLHPQPVGYLWAVMAASVIGFVGNEVVAIFRIRVGREIESAALIADVIMHGLMAGPSLACSLARLACGWGYPLADPHRRGR